MLNELRETLNRLPAVATGAVVIIALAILAAAIYVQARPEPISPNSRYAETIYRKCTDAGCGHITSDSRLELVKKGYMPLERAEEPLGDGRKCPKCGKMTLQFARRGAQGEIIVTPPKPEND